MGFQVVSNAEKLKGRQNLILLCCVFIVPIAFAKLALELQWFDYGVTNQGSLLEKPIHLTDLGLASLQNEEKLQQPWLMVFNLPKPCTQACIVAFTNVHKTYIALGKEMKRVQPVALADHVPVDLENLSENRWKIIDAQILDSQTLDNQQGKLGDIFIVDPLGNVVLSHDLPAEEKALPILGKAILADFKKLLKYSRIG